MSYKIENFDAQPLPIFFYSNSVLNVALRAIEIFELRGIALISTLLHTPRLEERTSTPSAVLLGCTDTVYLDSLINEKETKFSSELHIIILVTPQYIPHIKYKNHPRIEYVFLFDELLITTFLIQRLEAAFSKSAIAIKNNIIKAVNKNLSRHLDPVISQSFAVSNEHDFHLTSRRLTLCVWDLSGYSAIAYEASTLSVEHEWTGYIVDFFSLISNVAYLNNGIIHKFTGDGAIVIFGLDESEPNTGVDNAVYAAVQLREKFLALTAQWATGKALSKLSFKALTIKCGIHTGDVFYGSVRLPHMDTMVLLGNSINLASRICANSQGSDILLSSDSVPLLKSHYAYPFDERHTLKNIPQPQQLWRISYEWPHTLWQNI